MQNGHVIMLIALSSLENETVMPNREKSTYKIKGKLPATLWVKVQKNNTHMATVSFCIMLFTQNTINIKFNP